MGQTRYYGEVNGVKSDPIDRTSKISYYLTIYTFRLSLTFRVILSTKIAFPVYKQADCCRPEEVSDIISGVIKENVNENRSIGSFYFRSPYRAL